MSFWAPRRAARLEIRQAMIQKKICMVGSFAVGKSSLVARYVQNKFSEKYQTTVGVKIDRKEIDIDGIPVRLILWDLHGEDDFQKVRATYLRGSSGILLVADGTRPETMAVARRLKDTATDAVGDVPFVLLINKNDLTESWAVDDANAEAEFGCPVLRTSAKSGERVDDAFLLLTREMVQS